MAFENNSSLLFAHPIQLIHNFRLSPDAAGFFFPAESFATFLGVIFRFLRVQTPKRLPPFRVFSVLTSINSNNIIEQLQLKPSLNALPHIPTFLRAYHGCWLVLFT